MPITIIPSFLFFCFVEGITPGPANLGSLNASMQYGKKTALRQWRGLFTGFFVDAMEAVLINYFLGASFSNYVKYLSWIGAAYIVWLAIKILFSKPPALFLVGCFLPFVPDGLPCPPNDGGFCPAIAKNYVRELGARGLFL